MKEALVENEVRSLIDEARHNELLHFFQKEGEIVKEDEQLTFYFNAEQELRIQINDFFAMAQIKSGNMHDEQRKKTTIKTERENFPYLFALFDGLGYEVESRWNRVRHEFRWEGMKVTLNDTQGYGYLIDIEFMTQIKNKRTVERLKRKLQKIGIRPSTKQELNERYQWYIKEGQTVVAVPNPLLPGKDNKKFIKVGTKSLISKKEYKRLSSKLRVMLGEPFEEEQFTYIYEPVLQSLRIMKTPTRTYVCLKQGEMHNNSHDEIEVVTSETDFKNWASLFNQLGYAIDSKWRRYSQIFKWGDATVQLGDTQVYGPVLDLEKVVCTEDEEKAFSCLTGKLSKLNVQLSTKEELDTRFAWYQKHWKRFITE